MHDNIQNRAQKHCSQSDVSERSCFNSLEKKHILLFYTKPNFETQYMLAIGVTISLFFLVQMSHQDKKLDHMTEMLQNVLELQRFQLQQSENQSQGALTNED